jgi:hypothetical protein
MKLKMEQIEKLEEAARKHSGVMGKQLSFFQGGKFGIQLQCGKIEEWAEQAKWNAEEGNVVISFEALKQFLNQTK